MRTVRIPSGFLNLWDMSIDAATLVDSFRGSLQPGAPVYHETSVPAF